MVGDHGPTLHGPYGPDQHDGRGRQIIEAHGDDEFGDGRVTQLKSLAGTYTVFPIVRRSAEA